jgi:hypothetical protein
MSKGGSQTTSVEVPEYIEEAAKRNLTKAEDISRIGYVPYYGPDVAAFSPLQEAAMQNVGGQAGAFGLATPAGGVMSGMPAAQEFAGGVRGYSSAPLYQQSIDELARQRPAQKSFIDSFFIDPITGQYGSRAGTQIDYITPYPETPVVTDDTGAVGVTAPVVAPPPVYTPETDPYGPTVSIPDVIDAYDTLPDDVLPPVVIAAGGLDPQVGDVIDNDVLKDQQNAIVEEAFQNYEDVLSNPDLTPEQVAAANPAFNPEIALANMNDYVTISTPTGDYTKKAIDLGSADFAAATGGTYVPPETETGLGQFVGGGTGVNTSDLTGQTVSYSDVADLAEQYSLAGKSTSAAGIRSIGGAYAQSPLGSGDLVETRYNPATGQSEIISVTPTEEYSFGSDLTRSLTDPNYNPEGTVVSRALDALFGGITSATPSAGPPPPAYDPTANESAASIAAQEARRAADLQQMATNPAAALAKVDKADRVDVQRKIDEVQTLSAAPRPPQVKGKYEAKDWIKENMGVSVDKNDAMDYLRNLQADWDRLNK